MTPPSFDGSRLLERLFESSWQAAVLVFLVLAVQRAFGNRLTPAWRHALWWIVLGRLLLPVTPSSAWSLFNLLPARGVEFRSRGFEASVEPQPGVHAIVPLSPMTSLVSIDNGSAPATHATPPIGSLIAVIWVLGATAMFLRLAIRDARFSRRVRERMRPASPALNNLLNECRTQMNVRRAIPLLQGDAVVSPALYGVFRTRLLLPAKVAEGCTSSQLRHVFLHELAHIRRHDLFVNGLSRILHALHWFNPVLAWAFRRIRADRELATDGLALRVAGEQESRAYGLTIVTLLEGWTVKDPQPGTVGILEDNTSLEHRIRAIALFRRPSRWAPAGALLVTLLAAISWTNAQAPRLPDVTEGSAVAGVATSTPPAHSSGKGRQLIQSRLESIRVPEVKYDHLPLGQVVRILTEETKARSLGVKFFLNSILDNPAAGAPVSLDPNTGAPIVIPTPEQVPLSDVIIRIDPPLRDIRMIDLLQAITQSASIPIAYTIEDYAVVFMYKGRVKLLTRTYRLDTEKLLLLPGSTIEIHESGQATKPSSTNGLPTDSRKVQESVRALFARLGVSLLPPNALFFNSRLGLLMVRATEEEVERVDQVMELLKARASDTPPWVPHLPARSTNGPPVVPPEIASTVDDLKQFALELSQLADALSHYPKDSPQVRDAQSRTRALHERIFLGIGRAPAPRPGPHAQHTLFLLPDQRWTLNGERIPPSEVHDRLRKLAAAGRAIPIMLRASSSVAAGDVIDALGFVKAAGFSNVGIGPVAEATE